MRWIKQRMKILNGFTNFAFIFSSSANEPTESSTKQQQSGHLYASDWQHVSILLITFRSFPTNFQNSFSLWNMHYSMQSNRHLENEHHAKVFSNQKCHETKEKIWFIKKSATNHFTWGNHADEMDFIPLKNVYRKFLITFNQAAFTWSYGLFLHLFIFTMHFTQILRTRLHWNSNNNNYKKHVSSRFQIHGTIHQRIDQFLFFSFVIFPSFFPEVCFVNYFFFCFSLKLYKIHQKINDENDEIWFS